MAKKTSLLSDIHAARRMSGLNQTAFWTRFGVTQSGGSRYESGRNMPTPLKLLISLYEAGKIDDAMLEDARKALAKAKKK